MDLSYRKYIVIALFISVSIIFIGRFFFIQVVDTSYQLDAANNSQRYIVKYPARGLIYDRNGKLIVANEAAYDLMVVPGQVSQLDTLALINLLKIDKKKFIKNLSKAASNSFKPEAVVKQISAETYINLQENLHRFPGFYVQVRNVRKYPYKSAGILLGYIREVDKTDISNDSYYKQRDYIGKRGIEQIYEKHLRGEKGGEYQVVDVHGRVKEKLKGGEYDKPSILGKSITTTLDIDLQNYGERLMKNKIGCIVAIQPSTGEVLALVSSPSFDPNILVGRGLAKNFNKLISDTLFPLFNRAIQGDRYPPGSTFKVLNALVGLEENIMSQENKISCNMGYRAGGLHVNCHDHPSPVNLTQSIQMSCNTYYCTIFRATLDAQKYGSVTQGYEQWRKHIASFGLGLPLGIDLRGERPGFIPQPSYYNRYYGENKWKSLTVISLAIGQGEISMTPLQLANTSAAIANRGYYYTPHIVKQLEDTTIDKRFKIRHNTSIDPEHFKPVIDGMHKVIHGGEGATARYISIPGIEMCGKTGTAQNPHGENHSIFMAFAPKENPEIAVAVYVENAGYGSTWAAPIASLIIENYLTDSVHRSRKWIENRMLESDLLSKEKDAN
ncbi:MAG: penicillin-binding protein 2 [Bacteroidales bacterium]